MFGTKLFFSGYRYPMLTYLNPSPYLTPVPGMMNRSCMWPTHWGQIRCNLYLLHNNTVINILMYTYIYMYYIRIICIMPFHQACFLQLSSFLFHQTRPEEQEEELAAATAEPKGVQAEYFRWDLPGGAQAVVRGGLWTELVEVIVIILKSW